MRALALEVARLKSRIRSRGPEVLERLRAHPTAIMAGMTADAWQGKLLTAPPPRTLVLCSRQAGKSTVAAALALLVALTQPAALVLLLSPSLRQSGELFRKVSDVYRSAGRPVAASQESALRLELANGSRIVSLPGTEGTIRGFSGVALLIIDEAARVPDELYLAVRPMLAVSRGVLIALSTPFGKRGWFYTEWTGPGDWERIRIPATDCPRISREFLDDERRALGPRWFAQEYLCSFEETTDSVFATVDIHAALADDVAPLFGD